MADQKNNPHRETYIPPTPQNVKPKGSADNAVEMGKGGEAERETLAAQRDKLDERLRDDGGIAAKKTPSAHGGQQDIAPVAEVVVTPEQEQALGRTDNPRGTGVGYAGEGGASYGTQGATGDRETLRSPAAPSIHAEQKPDQANRTSGTNTPKEGPMPEQRQPEQQHPQQSAGSGHGNQQGQQGQQNQRGQQSTGSMPPSQGTGSTPQSHTAATDATAGHKEQSGNTTQTTRTESATPGQQKPEDTKAQTENKATDLKDQAQEKAADLKDQAQEKADDLKGQAQDKVAGARDGAQGKLDDAKAQMQSTMSEAKDAAQMRMGTVTEQAQATLDGVRTNVQAKTDELKGTINERTDQLKSTVSEKTDQWKGTVGEKGDQAKQTADEKATQAGERLTGLAGTLREKTQTLDEGSPAANAATKAAGALEQTGAYLQQATPDDWVADLKRLIERKPIESVLLAAILGFIISRASSRSGNDS